MSKDIKQETEWDSLVSGQELIAADFWAPWCPYCMRLKPVFEDVASNYPHINFVKVNIEELEGLASRYGIQGIPVIKFFCEGKEVGEIVGYVPRPELEKKTNQISRSVSACLTNTSNRNKAA